jgi:hypothetical protein
MPYFKSNVTYKQDNSAAFDSVYSPGTRTPHSGVYHCAGCGFEIVSTEGHPLPPEHSCPQHSSRWRCRHGEVRWQLVSAPIHVNNN